MFASTRAAMFARDAERAKPVKKDAPKRSSKAKAEEAEKA